MPKITLNKDTVHASAASGETDAKTSTGTEPVTISATETCDCIIVGAGPAGLVAAVYLARYRRNVRVFDRADSRALKIPLSRNVPGFPDGIGGVDFLERLRRQAQVAGVQITEGCVETLTMEGELFIAKVGDGLISAPCALLTTGTRDEVVPANLPVEATLSGQVRWCPICDGNESLDRKVIVVGDAEHGPAHALFLRTYTRNLILVVIQEGREPSAQDVSSLADAGIEVISKTPVSADFPNEREGSLKFSDGSEESFDVLYPMTGCQARSSLATGLGIECDEEGSVKVDTSQQTNIPHLYAAGDVVCSLKQISVAVAEAAIAATSIHNALPDNFR